MNSEEQVVEAENTKSEVHLGYLMIQFQRKKEEVRRENKLPKSLGWLDFMYFMESAVSLSVTKTTKLKKKKERKENTNPIINDSLQKAPHISYVKLWVTLEINNIQWAIFSDYLF